MSVKRYSVWEDEMFDEKHALNPKNSMVHLMVMHEDYAALEVRCAALAADNGILLAIMNEQAGSFGAALAEGFHDAVMESGSDQLIDIYQRRLQQAIQCIPPTTSTDAFLAEVRAQGVTEYASKRGFSFQHGCIHAHFGNGDVMVGAVTFENGDAGINFAPVREKTGGVGTSYEWTKGKTADQVDSVFIIASSNAEGLEVIRDKLNESIEELRKGVQS
ncbi:hypothetical protein [Enterobacter hormaechei]|uniref:hypothetical protein n=1 Tax=Enterobacter hormaechei TaxID=158836 RepID=UPI000792008F|nr:hypothetical protein [Enterobacter hormaechei]CZW44800.1 Uncharacterised protein [Enterobacter hormaechei]